MFLEVPLQSSTFANQTKYESLMVVIFTKYVSTLALKTLMESLRPNQRFLSHCPSKILAHTIYADNTLRYLGYGDKLREVRLQILALQCLVQTLLSLLPVLIVGILNATWSNQWLKPLEQQHCARKKPQLTELNRRHHIGDPYQVDWLGRQAPWSLVDCTRSPLEWFPTKKMSPGPVHCHGDAWGTDVSYHTWQARQNLQFCIIIIANIRTQEKNTHRYTLFISWRCAPSRNGLSCGLLARTLQEWYASLTKP